MSVAAPADQLEIGEELARLEILVTEEFNEHYLHAVEDFHRCYTEHGADGAAIVHPALLINFSNVTRSPSFHLPPGMAAVHTHEDVELFRPALVGQKLQISWKVTDRFEKRGRPYQVVESTIERGGGQPVLRRVSTYTYMGGAHPGATGEARASRSETAVPKPPLPPGALRHAQDERAGGGVLILSKGEGLDPRTFGFRVGDEHTGVTKTVTSYRTWLFSGGWPVSDGWPAKNVHTDLDAARRCGLPTRAASAAMLIGYLAELMIEQFGEEWMSRGKLSLKFIRVVDVGDRVVSVARVRSVSPGDSDAAVELDVWCENQRGEKVAVGTAAGRSP